ncbi:C2H2-type zinc finger protein [Endozoicomonas sp. 2B-B]
MTTQQLFVEVTSTQAIYLKEANVLPFPDTHCITTKIQGEQLCFGNKDPARVRLQPTKSIKLGLSPQSISQLKFNASLPSSTSVSLAGQSVFPEFDSGTEAYKQGRWPKLFRSYWECTDGQVREGKQDGEDETIEWYVFEESGNEPDDSNDANIRYEEPAHEETPLKPDTRYCLPRCSDDQSQISRASPGDGNSEGATGNEGQSSPENTKNQENEDEGTSEDTSENAETEENHHENIEPCRTCGESFCEHPEFYFDTPTKANFPEAASETAKPHTCIAPDCNRRFTSVSNRNAHARRIHGREKPHACTDPYCNRRFAVISDRNAHIRRIHAREKPHLCTYPDCNHRFASATERDRHIRRMHTMEKPYACSNPNCDRRFISNSDCNMHFRRMHNREKPHACIDPGCDRRFAFICDRDAHIFRVHASEKPYACSEQDCDRQFVTATERDTHTRSKHTMEKPYACDKPDCNRRFASSASLNAHGRRMHSEEPKRKRQRIENQNQPVSSDEIDLPPGSK